MSVFKAGKNIFTFLSVFVLSVVRLCLGICMQNVKLNPNNIFLFKVINS